MSTSIVPPSKTLAIALGANLPSKYGPPTSTLIEVRRILKEIVEEWLTSSLKENINSEEIPNQINWRWSPLFETKPFGGPPKQANYINAVVLIDGPIMEFINPSEKKILNLLEKTLKLEKELGRIRGEKSIQWGPRCIDIDLLAWGELQVKNKKLILPHPRLIERSFVVTPLAAALKNSNTIPVQLQPRKGWIE